MFVSSTGSKLLSQWLHGSDDTSYTYDFELLIKAISLFYGYNFLVPVLLYVVTTYYYKFPHGIHLVRTISIFGYTNVLWIPITLVNLIIVVLISNILEWLIVAASGLITGLSNIVKLSPIIKKNCDDLASDKLYYGIIGALAIVHLGFTVVVKISFFSF
ncbi:yipf1 Protein YIPF1 [Candida maltosa Xu316]